MKKDKGYPDSKVIDHCFDKSEKKLEEVIDKDFNGVYKSKPNYKAELSIIGTSLVVGLLVPVNLFLRLVIGLFLGCTAEFIYHNGMRFLFRDMINKYLYKGDVVNRTKLKIGEFKPVIIGMNSEGDVEVREAVQKSGEPSLHNYRLYIADKETLGDMIFRYMANDPVDLNSVTNKLVEEIKNEYVTTCIINSGKLKNLKESNYFNKK